MRRAPPRPGGGPRALRILAAVVLAAAALAGCGFPRDCSGALDRIRGKGVLHAGASHHPPHVVVEGDAVRGPEAERVEAFARAHRADVVWHVGGEAWLVDALEAGNLDVAAGGFLEDSPWKDRVGFTRPWEGERVIAVRAGENALLLALDRFLASAARQAQPASRGGS